MELFSLLTYIQHVYVPQNAGKLRERFQLKKEARLKTSVKFTKKDVVTELV